MEWEAGFNPATKLHPGKTDGCLSDMEWDTIRCISVFPADYALIRWRCPIKRTLTFEIEFSYHRKGASERGISILCSLFENIARVNYASPG